MNRDWKRRRVREEIANTLTHGLGLALSLAGFALLVAAALRRGGVVSLLAAVLYGASLVALYGASTLYHASGGWRRKHGLRLLDHASIYLLIAGSYTPFALLVLKGAFGWAVFALVWGLAVSGICLKTFHSHRPSALSTWSYVLMGWLALGVIKPLYAGLPHAGFLLLVAGGLCYTLGVYFYLFDRHRFHHAVWHLFVLAGSACHFVVILRDVLGAG